MDAQTHTTDAKTELEAMTAIHAKLASLSPDAQTRVIDWVTGALSIRTSVSSGRIAGRAMTPTADAQRSDVRGEPEQSFATFADLLGDSGAKTEADRSLVGGYWLQVVQGAEDFGAQAVNELLKDTGHAVGNITRAFTLLKEANPQLVRQLQKSGKTQQARKKYKLTQQGIARVERLLRDPNEA